MKKFEYPNWDNSCGNDDFHMDKSFFIIFNSTLKKKNLAKHIDLFCMIFLTCDHILDTNFKPNEYFLKINQMAKKKVHFIGTLNNELSLEEKGQYVTNAFTLTCNYLVFTTKFLSFTTSVTSC